MRDWREGCEQKRFFVRNVGLDDLKAILVLPQPARVASFSAFLEANPGHILDSKLPTDSKLTFLVSFLGMCRFLAKA